MRISYKKYYEYMRLVNWTERKSWEGYGMSSVPDLRHAGIDISHLKLHEECYTFPLKKWKDRAKEMKRYLDGLP